MSDKGEMLIVLSRPIHYPRELLSDYDISYEEKIPPLQPTVEEKQALDTEYEAIVAAAKAAEAAVSQVVEECVPRPTKEEDDDGPGGSRSGSSGSVKVLTWEKFRLSECTEDDFYDVSWWQEFRARI